MKQKYKNQELHLQHIRATKIFFISFILIFIIVLSLLYFYKFFPFYIIVGFTSLGSLIALYFGLKAVFLSIKAYQNNIYKK